MLTVITPTLIVAANVRAEMGRQRLNQAQVADALGFSQASVSARLRGRTPFDVNELAKLAALFDVPPSRLLEGVAA